MKRTTTGSSTIGFSARAGELGHGPVVIVGAGLAGLFTALKLAPLPVTVISAAPLGKGAASAWAQGGIAAAVGRGDTIDAHTRDTISSGAGLVDHEIAAMVSSSAPARVHDLLKYGVPFDRAGDGDFILSKEAAHSKKRIVRVSGDKAGAAIMATLIDRVRETPSIRILEGYELEDLITTKGAISGLKLVKRTPQGEKHHEITPVSKVVLATGGIGALYRTTTNPAYSRGTSLAIAARAGAVISDAEFVQFHPTALDFGIDPAPLATESLRGEGAHLINKHGERFMMALHEDGELAPRDIVARGVHAQHENGLGAYLDCRTAIGDRFEKSFPTVYDSCQRAGYNPATQPLPVVTAAHYHMGGIATNASARTTVPGLWAVGEVAATGLHGANRLASNSLLETLVFGQRAAKDITALTQTAQQNDDLPLKLTAITNKTGTDEATRISAHETLRKIMSGHAGVIRSETGLRQAMRELASLEAAHSKDKPLANMILAARFVVISSLLREESRGAQFRSDFPASCSPAGKRTFLTLDDLNTMAAKDERQQEQKSQRAQEDKHLATSHA